jgi:hypothetical protein
MRLLGVTQPLVSRAQPHVLGRRPTRPGAIGAPGRIPLRIVQAQPGVVRSRPSSNDRRALGDPGSRDEATHDSARRLVLRLRLVLGPVNRFQEDAR